MRKSAAKPSVVSQATRDIIVSHPPPAALPVNWDVLSSAVCLVGETLSRSFAGNHSPLMAGYSRAIMPSDPGARDDERLVKRRSFEKSRKKPERLPPCGR